jgi:CRP-like cAMP-binding protein
MPEAHSKNLILDSMSEEDLKLIEPDLHLLDLPLRYRLGVPGVAVEWVYFVDDGIASMTSRVRNDVPVEIGLVGREGVANISILLGSQEPISNTYMQVSGSGRRLAVDRLHAAVAQSPTLHALLLKSLHVLMVQTAATALANGRATISERLARWLLMARDRLDQDEMPLTHEFLAMMLGVRRPGVTVALRDFERQGLVSGTRGTVTILDRAGLEILANGYYGFPEAEWRRMFASS